jgi:hypothetical protein
MNSLCDPRGPVGTVRSRAYSAGLAPTASGKPALPIGAAAASAAMPPPRCCARYTAHVARLSTLRAAGVLIRQLQGRSGSGAKLLGAGDPTWPRATRSVPSSFILPPSSFVSTKRVLLETL